MEKLVKVINKEYVGNITKMVMSIPADEAVNTTITLPEDLGTIKLYLRTNRDGVVDEIILHRINGTEVVGIYSTYISDLSYTCVFAAVTQVLIEYLDDMTEYKASRDIATAYMHSRNIEVDEVYLPNGDTVYVNTNLSREDAPSECTAITAKVEIKPVASIDKEIWPIYLVDYKYTGYWAGLVDKEEYSLPTSMGISVFVAIILAYIG